MKRKIIPLITSQDGKRSIVIDAENSKEILAYLRKDDRHAKKLAPLLEIALLLQQFYTRKKRHKNLIANKKY